MNNQLKVIYLICVIVILIIRFVIRMKKARSASTSNDEYVQAELDRLIEINKLNLYYEAHLVGVDGENFSYNIYFDDDVTDEKLEEIKIAIESFKMEYENKDIYLGYTDISKFSNNIINIYLDLGGVEANYENILIQGILRELNNVKGIKKVLINE